MSSNCAGTMGTTGHLGPGHTLASGHMVTAESSWDQLGLMAE